MGSGRGFHCTHCNCKITARWGKGFKYPLVYQETIQGMKEGRYGDVAKAFLDEHPDGAVNAEETLARCDNVFQYDVVTDFWAAPKTAQATVWEVKKEWVLKAEHFISA